jgi:hypothetical protein
MKLGLAMTALAVLALVAQASVGSPARSSPSRSAACAPGYRPCLPVRADLDCDQIAARLKPIRVTGDDPYGLDADRDGVGCEPSWDDDGSGLLSRWGLIIRRPLTKEAQTVAVGNTVWAVGWSPRAFRGRRFEICAVKPRGRCMRPVRRLNGRNQRFTTWTVRQGDTAGGLLRLRLRVAGRGRADDFVGVQ